MENELDGVEVVVVRKLCGLTEVTWGYSTLATNKTTARGENAGALVRLFGFYPRYLLHTRSIACRGKTFSYILCFFFPFLGFTMLPTLRPLLQVRPAAAAAVPRLVYTRALAAVPAGRAAYDAEKQQSLRDPVAFWADKSRRIHWSQPPTKVGTCRDPGQEQGQGCAAG